MVGVYIVKMFLCVAYVYLSLHGISCSRFTCTCRWPSHHVVFGRSWDETYHRINNSEMLYAGRKEAAYEHNEYDKYRIHQPTELRYDSHQKDAFAQSETTVVSVSRVRGNSTNDVTCIATSTRTLLLKE